MTKPLDDNVKRGRGRPGRDWDALFAEWLKSGLPRKQFLALHGIDWRNGSANKKTKDWERAIDETASHIQDMKLQMIRPQSKVAQVVDNVTAVPPDAKSAGKSSADGSPPPPPEYKVAGIGPANSWQQIQSWRNAQGATDWKTNDTIRMHIQLILKEALQKDAKGNWRSALKPAEVRQLAAAASDIQRTQRLSLGLSTENIGVDMPQTHIETPVENSAPKPNLFVVEISRSGRFVAARPRRVSGGEAS